MAEEKLRIVNTVCPRNCYSGCGMQIHLKGDKIIKVKGNENNPATRGKICLKGLSYPQMIDHPDRLLYPLKRKGARGTSQFERITWDEAMDLVYDHFKPMVETYGPESILYYVGSGNHGSIMQQYAYGFWYQLGGFTGTRGNLCDSAATEAIRYTFGAIKNSALTEIEHTELIILWGKNPSFTNMHSMYHIHKALEKGAKMVTIDPRLNESSNRSDLHLYPRCGTDGLLAIGVAKCMIDKGLVDGDFINKHVLGYEAYKTMLDDYSMEEIARLTEVSVEAIQQLVDMMAAVKKFTIILGKGYQRYSNGGQTTRAICALPVIAGAIGKRGVGLYFNDSQRPMQKWPYYPPKPQHIRTTLNMGKLAEIDHMQDPPIKGMWIEAANPMTSNPNRHKLEKALQGLDYMVCAEHFLTDTAKMADLVLPAAMFLEENDIIRSYGHSYLQLKQKVMACPREVKTDKEIYHMLGKRFGFDMAYLPEDDATILRQVISASGYATTLEEMKEKPYLFPEYDAIAYADKIFPTESGKIELYAESLQRDWGVHPLPIYVEPSESKYSNPEGFKKYPLQFMTAHAKERINSQFSQPDWLSEMVEPEMHIHTKDALARKIRNGDRVRVFNQRGEIYVKALVGEAVQSGTVNVFEGWYDHTHASVNKLTEDRATDFGHGAAFHNCLVEVEKVNEP